MPVALVTGPTAGLGNAFARSLAERGYDLVLVARDVTRLSAVATELGERFGHHSEILASDLADPEALREVERRLADESRPVDLLVNNAGFAIASGFRHSSADDEERLLDVHVRAVLRLTKAVVPVMVARGKGTVLNISSMAGFVPYGTYGAAKAWVTSFTEGLAGELAGTGVRAVVCCPGFVRTEFHARAGMSDRGLPKLAWLRAEDVVEETLRRLERGAPVIVPTARYRAAAVAARHTPRRLLALVARRAGFRAAKPS